MKILCVEDGSVDIDALENGELRDGKVLVYRQGSKPPFVLDIPNNNIARVLKELKEIQARLEYDMRGNSYYNVSNTLENYHNYITERIKYIENELKEDTENDINRENIK